VSGVAADTHDCGFWSAADVSRSSRKFQDRKNFGEISQRTLSVELLVALMSQIPRYPAC
jgi:hypothetical protein